MSSPIRIAILGVGKIAREQHVPVIGASEDFELVACISPNSALDSVPQFRTLEEALSSDIEFSAIAICTPPQVRGALTRQSIDAGLHVLMEKPPTMAPSEMTSIANRGATSGVTILTAWHSRYAAKVKQAREWVETRDVRCALIRWRESVRKWHPGQTWLWEPGGLGVFDPGINALSILTALFDRECYVKTATFEIPANQSTPIGVDMTVGGHNFEASVDFDFRESDQEIWDIHIEAESGETLTLSRGGAAIAFDGGNPDVADDEEYMGVYKHFARLIHSRQSAIDVRPLQLVADAFLVANIKRVEPFEP